MPSQESSDTKQCPFCAEMIKREARVCRFCNHDLETGRPVNQLPPPRSVRARSGVSDGVRLGCGMFIVLPIIIFLIFIGGCGVVIHGCFEAFSPQSSHSHR